jgi:hypothetical protein
MFPILKILYIFFKIGNISIFQNREHLEKKAFKQEFI